MSGFSHIQGQARAIEQLQRAVRVGKLAHALLFSGPPGIGKATTATALACALNCDSAPEGCEGGCSSCRRIQAGQHPDLITLQADGALIKIQQVRDLEQRLAFAPHEARCRVIVIDGAEQLNTNAANALLKSVEEPRPRTIFVLVSSAVHRVIPTLISRSQRIRFNPLDDASLDAVLVAAGVESGRLRQQAIELADGSPGEALALLSGEQLDDVHGIAQRLVDAARDRDLLAVFEAVTDSGKDRLQLRSALDWVRRALRTALIQQAAPGLEQRPPSVDLGIALSAPALLDTLHAVNDADRALERNINPALALENLLLEMREHTVMSADASSGASR